MWDWGKLEANIGPNFDPWVDLGAFWQPCEDLWLIVVHILLPFSICCRYKNKQIDILLLSIAKWAFLSVMLDRIIQYLRGSFSSNWSQPRLSKNISELYFVWAERMSGSQILSTNTIILSQPTIVIRKFWRPWRPPINSPQTKSSLLTLLHSECSKLHGVLANLSATGV